MKATVKIILLDLLLIAVINAIVLSALTLKELTYDKTMPEESTVYDLMKGENESIETVYMDENGDVTPETEKSLTDFLKTVKVSKLSRFKSYSTPFSLRQKNYIIVGKGVGESKELYRDVYLYVKDNTVYVTVTAHKTYNTSYFSVYYVDDAETAQKLSEYKSTIRSKYYIRIPSWRSGLRLKKRKGRIYCFSLLCAGALFGVLLKKRFAPKKSK